MPLRKFTPGLAVTLLILAGCTPQPSSEEGMQQQIENLSQGIARQQYAVQANELADRVIAQRNDHLLIDLRSDATGHIKTAQSRSPAELLSPQGLENLPVGRDIILVSENGGEAAQTALLLRISGLNAFYLDGGYAAWARNLGNASGKAATPDEAAAMARQQAVSCWFEGDYVAEAGLTVRSQSASKGYTPKLKPVTRNDTLGLGLGLGLGPQQPEKAKPAQKPANDSLGLGLGLGLGPKPVEPAKQKPRPKLLIGEGC